MPQELWRPDIVVGVDFGMTCTGESLLEVMFPKHADPNINLSGRMVDGPALGDTQNFAALAREAGP